jgi:hypothetical protein
MSAASIIGANALMTEAASTSETSLSFYQTTYATTQKTAIFVSDIVHNFPQSFQENGHRGQNFSFVFRKSRVQISARRQTSYLAEKFRGFPQSLSVHAYIVP